MARYVRQFKQDLAQVSIPAIWNDADVADACRAAGYHPRRPAFWTPALTLLTFLRQVLHACSCRAAVALTLAQAVAVEERPDEADADAPVSGDPSAYSQARQRLPRRVLEQLKAQAVQRLDACSDAAGRWCGRRVRIVDGSSTSMPDTPELQRAFPQPKGQRKGCGFPVARLVAMFCWESGALLYLRAASLHVSELRLVRPLYAELRPGDVVLGDRYFASFFDLAVLRMGGQDGVFRLHQCRPTDLRRGRRLGRRDHLVTWDKPPKPPTGVSAQLWPVIPESLTVRHVRVIVDLDGFRSRRLELVTTLLEPRQFPRRQLAALYRDRWMAELNLRSLKTTLGLEVLRCASVEMVHKELLMYQVAYNLIRLLMWSAAGVHACDVRRLSFAGTQQRVIALLPQLERCRSAQERQRLTHRLLAWIARDRLPDRPNRIEPRCVKRRPKNYPRLTCPRHEARRRCRRDPQAFQR
jgi:hypothetical protein